MKSTKPNVDSAASRKSKEAGALAAMRRAAKVAHRRAAQCGHKIPISQDGKVVWIDPITDR